MDRFNWRSGSGIAMVILLSLVLSGCMYPGPESAGTAAATGEYIVLVENAIVTYQSRTGVLPIYNSSEDTPIYEKYRIDFQKLIDYNVLSHVPLDAYEKGGNYYYMLVDAETEPKVKLMDLRISQAAADMQRKIDDYKFREGTLPLGDEVRPHFYRIDFEKLRIKQAQAKSAYSPNFLVYYVHESGKVAIDYALEIMKLLSQDGSKAPDPAEDLRGRLLEHSPFIPVASYPYHWENGEPVIAEK